MTGFELACPLDRYSGPTCVCGRGVGGRRQTGPLDHQQTEHKSLPVLSSEEFAGL